jgi:D-alanyl-D-alanine endopeptidase (penicillin-binding protein 7)
MNDTEHNNLMGGQGDGVTPANSEADTQNPVPPASYTPSVAPGSSAMPVGRQLSILGLLLVGMFSLGAFSMWGGGEDLPASDQEASVGQVAPLDETDETADVNFDNITLTSEAAFVFDVRDSRVLYEREADRIKPLASITKLMTALVASEIVKEGTIIPITAAAINQDGTSGLSVGETFSYRTLSDLVLLSSSNDGAYALSAAVGEALDPNSPDAAFVKAMNVRAKELGLNSTYFRNPTGLDVSESEAGAYSTAREVAALMSYILQNRPEILEATTHSLSVVYDEAGNRHEIENTNRVIDAIPTAIASKTGYTTLSGGNLVVAFDAGVNRPVVVVVLGSSHQGRFTDILSLVAATRNQLKAGE